MTLVTSLTFIATATSVSMTGATPVFAEVEPDYWCLDVEDVKKRITGKTKAIIGVHLFGQCYSTELIHLCGEHNLALIEDAAQAHGASIVHNGTPTMAGALGTVSCFSFFPSKNVAVGGEGGMITLLIQRLEPESNPLSIMAETGHFNLKKLEPTCGCLRSLLPLVVCNWNTLTVGLTIAGQTLQY